MRIEGEAAGRLDESRSGAAQARPDAPPVLGEPRPPLDGAPHPNAATTPAPERVAVRHTISEVIAAKGVGPAPLEGGAAASAAASRGATAPAAILLIVAAVFFFSLLDVTAKSLVTGEGLMAPWLLGPEPIGSAILLSSLFVAWARFALHTAIVGVGMGLVQRRPILRVRSWPWQIARSACMASATLLNFTALAYLQLAETVAIFFVAPMVVTALAGPLLGEWVGWRRWLAILAGFGGVLLMTRPGTELFQPAVLLSIGSMLGYSFYVLLTRKLAATETPESLLFTSTLVPTIAVSAVLPFAGAWTLPEGLGQWLLVLSLGVYGVVGHLAFVLAYGRASTGALAPFTYVQIPFMVALGWLVFGNLPDATTWVGIAVIVAAGLYIVLREHQLHREAAAAPDPAGR